MDQGTLMEVVTMVAVDMVAEVEVGAEVAASGAEEGDLLKDLVAIMIMVKWKYQLLKDVVSDYLFTGVVLH